MDKNDKKRGGRRPLVSSGVVLVIGFTAVVVLMGLVVSVGMTSMAAITDRLELIVQNHNVKRELVDVMYLSARERVYGLQKMLLLEDPFDRDEEAMRIDRFGTEFGVARTALLAMDLNAGERMVLEEQGRLAQRAVPVQRTVARLIMEERTVEARDRLLDEAIPLQEGVLQVLERLRAIQTEATQTATTEALSAQRHARNLMLALGAGALLLAAFIAAYTIRRVRRAENDLATEKERAEITLHAIGDGVISADADGRIDYINPVAQRLTGWNAGDACSEPLLAVFRLWDERKLSPLAESAAELLTVGNGGVVLGRRDDRVVPIEFTASALPAPDGGNDGTVVVFRDISEIRALAEQLDYQARHDPLTGLINRLEFERLLEDALESAHRESRRHVVCYLDLDKFKVVNDTCGHAAGDELLKQLACELRVPIRENDALARLGGDEFGVVLANCPLDKAQVIAEGLRRQVCDFQFLWENKAFQVGVSIGLVVLDHDCGSLADVLNAADAACYMAKEQGRGRVHVFRRQDEAELRLEGRSPWSERLRRALAENRFDLYIQPVHALAEDDDCQVRHEVLLRMTDEAGREVLPTAFLPAAERAGLCEAVDGWVLHRLLGWLAERPEEEGMYSVNISAQSLASGTFADSVVAMFRHSRVDPNRICFELSESAVLANLTAARAFIERLRQLGCRLVLDDFGSGLSSFAHLRHLDVDSLKINGRLILRLDNDPMNPALLEAINRIAHVLGIRTVAKFVEDQRTLERLRELGTDYAQGYGLATPRPLMEPEPLVAVS